MLKSWDDLNDSKGEKKLLGAHHFPSCVALSEVDET
jgi:hypothetical protein